MADFKYMTSASILNGRWISKGNIIKCCGTIIEITEDYVLNNGIVFATLYSTYSSTGKKFFNKDEGGVVHYNTDFAQYFGSKLTLQSFTKIPIARKHVEKAAKILVGMK